MCICQLISEYKICVVDVPRMNKGILSANCQVYALEYLVKEISYVGIEMGFCHKLCFSECHVSWLKLF